MKKIQVTVLSDELFRSISSTEASQGVIALVRPPAWTVEQLFRGQALAVILDGLQDPGNAGAILRAAEAFGATGVVFLKGTVESLQSEMSASFGGICFPCAPGGGAGSAARNGGHRAAQTGSVRVDARKRRECWVNANFSRKCAIIVGSEGRGVSERLRAKATEVRIPTVGVESLNAALAAGIALYVARRQRMVTS